MTGEKLSQAPDTATHSPALQQAAEAMRDSAELRDTQVRTGKRLDQAAEAERSMPDLASELRKAVAAGEMSPQDMQDLMVMMAELQAGAISPDNLTPEQTALLDKGNAAGERILATLEWKSPANETEQSTQPDPEKVKQIETEVRDASMRQLQSINEARAAMVADIDARQASTPAALRKPRLTSATSPDPHGRGSRDAHPRNDEIRRPTFGHA
jgi:hypothetical protein